MATSNRDRISRMFDLLAPELEAFLHRGVGRTQEGKTWVDVYEAVDKGPGGDVNPGDPSVQLKFLSQGYTNRYRRGWRPLDKQFTRTHEAWAGELLQVRHSWAHLKSFTDDDAYRALDTAERLSRAVDATKTADEIAKVRLDLRRVTADKDDRRTLKTAASANPESSGLRPWREVLQPHPDVASGNFHAAEFAADLFKVARQPSGQGEDYADPVEFFRRTYLTDGLRDLIARAVRRLAGEENASPVINLQTNFGGGKTHSMLSLWHVAGPTRRAEFPQALQDLLVETGTAELGEVRRVALVGNHLSASGIEQDDGTKVNTIWGELAWQLGGAEAYAMVADDDRNRTPPALDPLLQRYSPAVILIDEWVAYARTLVGRTDLAGGTFDDQFTFAQSLTEAVKRTPGVLLAISIPASEVNDGRDAEQPAGHAEEVGGAHGQEALQRLQNVVRRVADQWRPASSVEAYRIVRQRLFVTPDAEALASIGATARAFVELYRKHPDEFPREARDAAYDDRIKQTYPIHPELFDRLYEDWSSLDRFQRTRGVLRLMNTVIHALWVGDDAGPLIMPGSIPLSTSEVNTEIAQYLEDSWKAVIDADVDGASSEPTRIDKERPLFGARALTRRLARTVFFGAAPTIGSAQKGLETQRVFLGTATPGDVPGNFHSALTTLGDRATYFYSGQGKYWYDLQANITRRAKDQAQNLHKEDVWAEIARRLAGQGRTRADFAAVHTCPEETADIPDTDEVRLVLLHPRYVHERRRTDTSAHRFAHDATERRGSAHRAYRNMVVFLAPDKDRMAELDSATRDYLAWTSVLGSHDLDLTQNQRNQAGEKRRLADQTVDARLLGTYQWALVPDQPDGASAFGIVEAKADGAAPSLAERVSRRLGNDGRLNLRQAASPIRLIIDRYPRIWEKGHVSVGELWLQYATYPYMPRLRDHTVLNEGVRDQPMLWQREGFALADGFEDGRYVGLVAGTGRIDVQISDHTLVVRPEVAEAQLEADRAVIGPDPGPDPDGGDGGSGGGGTTPPRPDPRRDVKRRFFGTKTLDRQRPAVDFRKIFEEILPHLDGSGELVVRLDIEAVDDAGFDEATVRTVSENATVLRFDQAGFEAE